MPGTDIYGPLGNDGNSQRYVDDFLPNPGDLDDSSLCHQSSIQGFTYAFPVFECTPKF